MIIVELNSLKFYHWQISKKLSISWPIIIHPQTTPLTRYSTSLFLEFSGPRQDCLSNTILKHSKHGCNLEAKLQDRPSVIYTKTKGWRDFMLVFGSTVLEVLARLHIDGRFQYFSFTSLERNSVQKDGASEWQELQQGEWLPYWNLLLSVPFRELRSGSWLRIQIPIIQLFGS